MKLEHIGIAVSDAEAAGQVLKDLLGVDIYKREYVESEAIETFFIDMQGPKVELLQAVDPDSALGKFVATRGPGLHHLAFEVSDIDAMFAKAKSAGYRVLSDGPYKGADGKSVFFIHPKDTSRVLLEFCQSTRPSGTTILFDDHVIDVVGNPSGRRVIVSGTHAASEVVRLLEPALLVLVLPNDLPITDSLLNEILAPDTKYDFTCLDRPIDMRLDQLNHLTRGPECVAVYSSTARVSINIEFSQLLILLDDDGATTLSDGSQFLSDDRVHLSSIPFQRGSEIADEIAGTTLRAFLTERRFALEQ